MNIINDRILQKQINNSAQEGMVNRFDNSTQIFLNEFYYQRVWATYGGIFLLFLMQSSLYFVTKSKEITFTRRIDSFNQGKIDDSISNIGDIHQFDINYSIIGVFDVLIVIQLIILNYHEVQNQKISKQFYSRDLIFNDIKMRFIPFLEQPWLFISNFLMVFKPCIFQSLLIILL